MLTIESKSMKARNDFLKRYKEFPEYVCTSCHCMLFYKGVQLFDESKYDFSCEAVSDTLSERFQYKATDKAHEYICQTCHLNLKELRMPVQAVANQLEVPDIADELYNLTQLEVHCIALRIPFMTIQAMPKVGLGKITGPCINVPSSLEPITDVLPRVPENTQLVLLKLKRMLVYKSHYLCDFICPNVVMDALKWLKENNPHYCNVKIDERWLDKFQNDPLYGYVADKVDTEMHEEMHLENTVENCHVRNDNIDGDHDATEPNATATSDDDYSENEKIDEEMEEANLKEADKADTDMCEEMHLENTVENVVNLEKDENVQSIEDLSENCHVMNDNIDDDHDATTPDATAACDNHDHDDDDSESEKIDEEMEEAN